VPFIAVQEGFTVHPYIDRIGTGHPETWCFGETGADTGGIVPPLSAVFTKAECTPELQAKLTNIYDAGIRKCTHVSLPPHREAALVSASYNIGVGAVCNGPIVRNLNAGRISLGCNALMLYTHANGKVAKGLVNRRKLEMAMCLRDD
jgi:lysozyme